MNSRRNESVWYTAIVFQCLVWDGRGGGGSIKGLDNSMALSQIPRGQNYTNSANKSLGSQE
jgi:hypothetical protein